MACEIYYFTKNRQDYFLDKGVAKKLFCLVKEEIEPDHCGVYQENGCHVFDNRHTLYKEEYEFGGEWLEGQLPSQIRYVTKYTLESKGWSTDEFETCLKFARQLANQNTDDYCIIFGNENALRGIAFSNKDCLELFAKCFNAVYGIKGDSLHGFDVEIVWPPNFKMRGITTLFSIERRVNKQVVVKCEPLGLAIEIGEHIDLTNEKHGQTVITDWYFPVKFWNNLQTIPVLKKTGDFFIFENFLNN